MKNGSMTIKAIRVRDAEWSVSLLTRHQDFHIGTVVIDEQGYFVGFHHEQRIHPRNSLRQAMDDLAFMEIGSSVGRLAKKVEGCP